jgi:DNA mismatch endonuclease (patch repair protein)
MVDSVSASRRSENMRRIASKDTRPEMLVRRLVHGMGYRYRLHAKDVAGKPDLVLRPRKKAIFVHGCFWHQHPGCREGRVPGSRQEYWIAKLRRNVERDCENLSRLQEQGWQTFVIWECETRNEEELKKRICGFLEQGRVPTEASLPRTMAAGK